MTVATSTTSTNSSTTEKLPLWQKVAYGMGDIYGGGTATILSFFYLFFLTDVVRINPAWAGTVILISKVYDAITDPFEGVISDRTRTRFGRRRPYFLAGIPLIVLSFFALFYPIDFDQELHRFVFVICTYLFYSTIVSIVMLNYNALQSELSLDYNERTSLSSARIAFSTIASIICALVPLEIVKYFENTTGDVRMGWIVMGLVFGVFFALPFIAVLFSARERKEFQKPPEKLNLRDTLIEPFKVRTFLLALLMYVTAMIALDSVGSVVVYFMKYYLLRGDEANYVIGTLMVFQVISLPIFAALIRRSNKRTGFIIGETIFMVVMLFSFLVTPSMPAITIYIFAALVGLGTGGIFVTIYAIFPDLPDVDELRTGERREGIFGALIQLMRKLSGAVGIFIVSNTLALTGYVQPVEQVVDGVRKIIEQPQTEQFTFALRLVFALTPIVFILISLIFAIRYPLGASIHQRLNNVLSVRRAGDNGETAEMQAEIAELERLLI